MTAWQTLTESDFEAMDQPTWEALGDEGGAVDKIIDMQTHILSGGTSHTFSSFIPSAGSYVIGVASVSDFGTDAAPVISITAAGVTATPLNTGIAAASSGNGVAMRFYEVTTTRAGDLALTFEDGIVFCGATLFDASDADTESPIDALDRVLAGVATGEASFFSATALPADHRVYSIAIASGLSARSLGYSAGVDEVETLDVGSTSGYMSGVGEGRTGNQAITANAGTALSTSDLGVAAIALPIVEVVSESVGGGGATRCRSRSRARASPL